VNPSVHGQIPPHLRGDLIVCVLTLCVWCVAFSGAILCLGDARFKQFEEWCCEAYNILRKHANLFLDLFVLMIPAGVPELVEKGDIGYLLKQLSLDLDDEDAENKFKKEISGSLANKFRRFDNMVHNMKVNDMFSLRR
jgi:hypothetical protein